MAKVDTAQSSSYSRYNFGVVTRKHRNKTVTSSFNSKEADALLARIPNGFKYKTAHIPPEYAHRPDLISNIFYGTPGYWWFLMVFNNISDSLDELNAGDEILIPEI